MQSKQNFTPYVPTINSFNFNAPNNLPRHVSAPLSESSGQVFYHECRFFLILYSKASYVCIRRC